MQPDYSRLIEIAGIDIPLIGFYDAPDLSAFEPLVVPSSSSHACVFKFFKQWLKGSTLHLTAEKPGCGGAGRSLCGVPVTSRADFIKFLVDEEGLKASRELMEEWLDNDRPYRPEHGQVLIGPLREAQYEYLKSVTFFVNPDQLGLLAVGAQYQSRPSDPPPLLAPFGSGCMQLVTLFGDLARPQAIVGATDIAMRQYLPPDVLAFTVTRPMLEQLCALDGRSFLYKPFWKNLRRARGHK
ncbi:MAG: hypothetical protein AMJ46_00175 [Latescibacteria bacterium DG_63]|nr:MAG: hypothetical protein AMJ46_00175 [Latescibacteria bacterium DG_63]